VNLMDKYSWGKIGVLVIVIILVVVLYHGYHGNRQT
jgi:hypothetical protein